MREVQERERTSSPNTDHSPPCLDRQRTVRLRTLHYLSRACEDVKSADNSASKQSIRISQMLLLLVLARTASPLDLAPLAKLRAVSIARPPESRLLSAKLDDASVAIWKWKEARMGDGAGAACTGVERALAERVRTATGGETMVLSTCARLDVYS